MKKHYEPFWWTWFSTGGTISAFLLPILLLIFGILIPYGWVKAPAYKYIYNLLDPLISRIIFFVIISLSMLHWAHRFRFTLYDGLQLQRFSTYLAFLCYGSAIIISLISGYFLWNF